MVAELREDLRSGQGVTVGALLKTIHDFARGLRTELELPVDSTWGRTPVAQRTQISDLLRAEIELMPGRVRRLLRPRPSKQIRRNSVLDPNEVAAVEALVEFVGNLPLFCRRARYQRNDVARPDRTTPVPRQRHAGPARGLAPRRGSRPQFPTIAGRRGRALLRQGIWWDYAALLVRAAEVAGAAEIKAARA